MRPHAHVHDPYITTAEHGALVCEDDGPTGTRGIGAVGDEQPAVYLPFPVCPPHESFGTTDCASSYQHVALPSQWPTSIADTPHYQHLAPDSLAARFLSVALHNAALPPSYVDFTYGGARQTQGPYRSAPFRLASQPTAKTTHPSHRDVLTSGATADTIGSSEPPQMQPGCRSLRPIGEEDSPARPAITDPRLPQAEGSCHHIAAPVPVDDETRTSSTRQPSRHKSEGGKEEPKVPMTTSLQGSSDSSSNKAQKGEAKSAKTAPRKDEGEAEHQSEHVAGGGEKTTTSSIRRRSKHKRKNAPAPTTPLHLSDESKSVVEEEEVIRATSELGVAAHKGDTGELAAAAALPSRSENASKSESSSADNFVHVRSASPATTTSAVSADDPQTCPEPLEDANPTDPPQLVAPTTDDSAPAAARGTNSKRQSTIIKKNNAPAKGKKKKNAPHLEGVPTSQCLSKKARLKPQKQEGRAAEEDQQQATAASCTSDAHCKKEEAAPVAAELQCDPVKKCPADVNISSSKAPTGKNKKKQRGTKEDDDKILMQLSRLRKPPTEKRSAGLLHRLGIVEADSGSLVGDPASQVEECLARQSALMDNPTARLMLIQQACRLADRHAAHLPPNVKINAEYHLADLHCEYMDFDISRDVASRALASARLHNLRPMIMRCLLVLGKCCESMVQADEARSFFVQVLALAKELHDDAFQAVALNHLGTTHELTGCLDESFRYYRAALALAKSRVGEHRIEVDIECNMGVAYLSAGELTRAGALLEPLIPSAVALRDHSLVARVLANAAHAHMLLGHDEDALRLLQQEYAHAEKVHDVFGITQALNSMGAMCRLARRYSDALQYFSAELQRCVQLSYPARLGEAQQNVGGVHRLLKSFALAREAHTKELALATDSSDVISKAKAFCNIADVDADEGKWVDAERNYLEALYCLELLSLEERTRYIVKAGSCEIDWRALDGLETVYCNTQRLEDAFACGDRKHLPILSDIVRKTFVCTGKVQIAGLPTTVPALPSSPAQLLKQRLIDNDVVQLVRSLGLSRLVMFSLCWEDDDAFRIFVVDDQSVKMVSRRISAEAISVLAAQASPFRKLLTGGVHDTPLVPHYLARMAEVYAREHESEFVARGLSSLLEPLYDDFVFDVEGLLPATSDSPVCFVTDGLIANVPFHALVSKRSDATNGTYLIQRFPVCAVPSVQFLKTIADGEAAKADVRQREDPPSRVLSVVGSDESAMARLVEGVACARCSVEVRRVQQNDHLHESVDSEIPSLAPLPQPLQDAFVSHATEGQPQGERIVVLQCNCAHDMRDEFSGALSLTPKPRDGLIARSEDIVAWGVSNRERVLQHVALLVNCGFSSFTYRVAHETGLSVLRSFLCAGVPRVLCFLWAPPSCSDATSPLTSLRDDLLSKLVSRNICLHGAP